MAKKTKSKENPDLLERGQKQRAGKLISEYLRAIGQEVTEIVAIPDPDPAKPPESRLVSKAEALARHLWDQANRVHDVDAIRMVLDRCDGKPSVDTDDGREKRESIPDRISRINAERVNQITEEVTGGGTDEAVQ